MNNNKEKATGYFMSNPSAAELFATSDGTLFLLKRDAVNHAKSIGDDEEVERFDREQIALELETIAAEKLLAEEARLADEAEKAEKARLAENARLADEAEKAEKSRLADEAKKEVKTKE